MAQFAMYIQITFSRNKQATFRHRQGKDHGGLWLKSLSTSSLQAAANTACQNHHMLNNTLSLICVEQVQSIVIELIPPPLRVTPDGQGAEMLRLVQIAS